MSRNLCHCGRRHRRMQVSEGVFVTGCPVHMQTPESLRALDELVKAAIEHADTLVGRTKPEAP